MKDKGVHSKQNCHFAITLISLGVICNPSQTMLDFDYLYTISDMLVVVCIYYGVPVVLSNHP